MNIDPADLLEPLAILGIKRTQPGTGGTGTDGKSAYQLWLDAGNVGTLQDFLDSLKGSDGKSAYQLWLDNGNVGTLSQFLYSLIGPKGDTGSPGLSAYQIWLSLGYTGTEQDFINSLKATGGGTGTGNSSYVTDNFVVTQTVLNNKSVPLSQTPYDPNKVSLVPYFGIEQKPNADFVVTGNILSWASLALELLFVENDTFVVRYSTSP